MNANRPPKIALRHINTANFFLVGAAGLFLYSSIDAAEPGKATFADDPIGHGVYNRMIEAMHQARSLSYISRYEYQAGVQTRTSCSYHIWLKKPNFFRMETRTPGGDLGGVMIGDGSRL